LFSKKCKLHLEEVGETPLQHFKHAMWVFLQMRTFADSSAQEVEKREDAHAILRALTAIERQLQADVDALALVQRKGKHRGND
jgi:hypothetical protein